MVYSHEREVAVFEAALELPPGERDAFLAQASAGDPELLQRVRALLHAAENGADFLAPLPSELAPSRLLRSRVTASAVTSCWNKLAKEAAASCIWPRRRSRFGVRWP